MASQIAHIVYAKKFLENDHPSWIDKDQFILGCVFPDIRLIDKTISRKDTHMHFSQINLDFSGLTSFEAGWKFHLYCDLKREEILNREGFFKIDGADNYYGRSNKFLEDKLVYKKYNNWEKLVHLFNNVPKNGNLPNVSHETVGMWYAIIANYIKEVPNYKSTHIIIAKILNNADGIISGLKELEQNKKAVEVLEKISEEII